MSDKRTATQLFGLRGRQCDEGCNGLEMAACYCEHGDGEFVKVITSGSVIDSLTDLRSS